MCPRCGTDLTGSAIPQDYIDKGYYGDGVTHYSRKIGHYDLDLDRTTEWSCPDCAHTWPVAGADEAPAGLRTGDTAVHP